MPYRTVSIAPAPRTASRALEASVAAVSEIAAQRAVMRERIGRDVVGAAMDLADLLRGAMQGREAARRGALVLASTITTLREGGTAEDVDRLRDAALQVDRPALAAMLEDPPPHAVLAHGGQLPDVGFSERRSLRAWAH
ncbi:MAG: hypothetical protein WCJ30_28670, partial [Deltaproteobacteria bacterium]